MSWHFLQEGEAVSWEESSLDGAPFALSRLIPTLEKSSLPVSEMESLNPSPSGTTLQPSTELRGEEPLMSLVEDSPVKILAQPERVRESKGSEADYGWKWQGSFVKYDPSTSSWRTRQYSLVEGLDVFSGTWPRWGTMQNGECLERITLELPIGGIESGLLLPTPTANRYGTTNNGKRGDGTTFKTAGTPSLYTMALHNRWPEEMLGEANGGPLNPAWVEWLMGWPIGWTDSEPLETARYQQWLNSHGRF